MNAVLDVVAVVESLFSAAAASNKLLALAVTSVLEFTTTKNPTITNIKHDENNFYYYFKCICFLN